MNTMVSYEFLLFDDIKLNYTQDQEYMQLLSKLEDGSAKSTFSLSDCLTYYMDKIYVSPCPTPDVTSIAHDCKIGGHRGVRGTLSKAKDFTWPTIRSDTQSSNPPCDTCQQAKPNRRTPAGYLHHLPTPMRPFDANSIDFVGTLPTSEGYNFILVVVNRLIRRGIFIPTST